MNNLGPREERDPDADGFAWHGSSMSIQTIIEHYLLKNHVSDGSRNRIDNHELLFALGILDSLAFVQLIAFIQEEFNITIQDHDVVVENFRNLNAIAALILRIQD